MELDKLCTCGHPVLDHWYIISPWWKFWEHDYYLGTCFNIDCRHPDYMVHCRKFKLDNLKYLEQCYERQ